MYYSRGSRLDWGTGVGLSKDLEEQRRVWAKEISSVWQKATSGSKGTHEEAVEFESGLVG
jgi:hypothetical protein